MGRVGLDLGLSATPPGASFGELFTEPPPVSHASRHHEHSELVIMSCAAELRALRRAAAGLRSKSRFSYTATASRAASTCTRCRTFYSASSITPARSTQGCNVSLRKAWPQNVRFISQAVEHKKHRAYVALGGNMGDRVAMIEQACKEMEAGGNIKILRTSSLWETKAMYVVDQDMFVNGACEVRLINQGHAFSILICTDRNIAIPNRAAR